MRDFWWLAGIGVAGIVTAVIRGTVFGEDCNLVVVGMTFLVVLAVVSGAMLLFRKLKKNRDGNSRASFYD